MTKKIVLCNIYLKEWLAFFDVLQEKKQLNNAENLCSICPRGCKINRNEKYGFCNEGDQISIAKVVEHFCWEEPCLSDKRGVLAIFFSGCNLKCDYCQNHEISRGQAGKIYTTDEFAKLIEEKQNSHCAIDLITPTHFTEPIFEAFKLINKTVPVIWNTNAYETMENINKVGSFVDIFLPDLKYADNNLGQKFSACKDYSTFAVPAIQQMCKLKKDVFEKDILKQGVIIRHLVLPGYVENSLKVLDIIAKNFPDRMISLMSQFTPNGKSTLNRKLTPIEYKLVLSHLDKLGLNKGFVQELSSANTNFVPDF